MRGRTTHESMSEGKSSAKRRIEGTKLERVTRMMNRDSGCCCDATTNFQHDGRFHERVNNKLKHAVSRRAVSRSPAVETRETDGPSLVPLMRFYLIYSSL